MAQVRTPSEKNPFPVRKVPVIARVVGLSFENSQLRYGLRRLFRVHFNATWRTVIDYLSGGRAGMRRWSCSDQVVGASLPVRCSTRRCNQEALGYPALHRLN